MTTPDPIVDIAEDEVLIYIAESEVAPEGLEDEGGSAEPVQLQFGDGRFRFFEKPGLTKVKITDDELERLRKQVKRIASKLDASSDASQDEPFAVDSVALHVGISATGQFVLASAGVEVAVDIIWKRRQPPNSRTP
jgi:hypothetical protein